MSQEMQRILRLDSQPVTFHNVTQTAPRSNCILDSSKLLKTGVKLRPITEAFADCLDRLRLSSRATKPFVLASKAFLTAL
jgi:hypothetical protein